MKASKDTSLIPNISSKDDDKDSRKDIHVLLVEDSNQDAFLLEDMISRLSNEKVNFIVNHVSDFKGAVEYAGSEKAISVILLDLFLPDAKGIETVEKALMGMPEHPIIVITALNDNEFGYKALNIGAQDFLIKEELSPKLILRSIMHTLERCEFRRFCDNYRSLEFINRELKIAERLAQNLEELTVKKEIDPETRKKIKELTDELEELIDKGVVQMLCNVDLDVSKELKKIAAKMKKLGLTAEHAIDIYRSALMSRCDGSSELKTEVIVEESRILILELLSYLTV